MLDLLWRVRFRWKLWPRQVTGDRKYDTEENIAAIEREHIHAYIPLPDHDHRTHSLAQTASVMRWREISTSVPQAKNSTLCRGNRLTDNAATGRM